MFLAESPFLVRFPPKKHMNPHEATVGDSISTGSNPPQSSAQSSQRECRLITEDPEAISSGAVRCNGAPSDIFLLLEFHPMKTSVDCQIYTLNQANGSHQILVAIEISLYTCPVWQSHPAGGAMNLAHLQNQAVEIF